MKYILLLLTTILSNTTPILDIPSRWWGEAQVIVPQENPLLRQSWSNEWLHSWSETVRSELTVPGREFIIYRNTSWDYRRLLQSKSYPIRPVRAADGRQNMWEINVVEPESYLQIVIIKESKWAGSAGPFTIYVNDVPTKLNIVVHPGDILYIGYPFGYFVHSKILDDMIYPIAGHPPLLKLTQGINTIRIEDRDEWAYGVHIRVGQAWVLLDEGQ